MWQRKESNIYVYGYLFTFRYTLPKKLVECPEWDSNPRLLVSSQAWKPLHTLLTYPIKHIEQKVMLSALLDMLQWENLWNSSSLANWCVLLTSMHYLNFGQSFKGDRQMANDHTLRRRHYQTGWTLISNISTIVFWQTPVSWVGCVYIAAPPAIEFLQRNNKSNVDRMYFISGWFSSAVFLLSVFSSIDQNVLFKIKFSVWRPSCRTKTLVSFNTNWYFTLPFWVTLYLQFTFL